MGSRNVPDVAGAGDFRAVAAGRVGCLLVRDHNHLEGVLHSIRCEEKTACRAIQMADLLAFYSRRHIVKYAATSKAERESSEPDVMLKIIAECVNIRAAVGIDLELLAITASHLVAAQHPD